MIGPAVCSALLLLTWGLASSADPPVEGDLALLDILRDAQRANEGRYPHGEFRAITEHGTVGARRPELQLEGTLRWDGSQCHFEGNQTSFTVPNGVSDPNYMHRRELKVIIYNHKLIIYDVDRNVLQIAAASKVGPPFLFPQRPEEGWYRIGWRPLAELLGPHPKFNQERVRSYSIKRKDDQIELVRHDHDGGRLLMVASLKDDANIVQLKSERSDGSWTNDRFRWGRDGKGRLYLAERHHEAYHYEAFLKRWSRYYTKTELSYFNADYRPPSAQFDQKSLGLQQGARVEDQVARRNYRLGEAPVESVVDRFAPLIEAMKKSGFAKPRP